MWMRLTWNFFTLSRMQPKRLSQSVIKTAIFRVGMRSVNPSIEPSCSLLRETTRVWLLQLHLTNLTGNGEINDPTCRIDVSQPDRKAWSISNNLTGRSRHSPRHCLTSANAIVSQLVRNRKYEAVDRKSSRLVFQRVSDFGVPQHQTQ